MSAQQPQGPSSELPRKVCTTASTGKDRLHWRDRRYWEVVTHLISLATRYIHYHKMKECCNQGFPRLCPLTEINRHLLPERCLLEVNTLNILIIFILHVLMAKSWLALPSYAVVSSRWEAYVHSTPCIWAGPDVAQC